MPIYEFKCNKCEAVFEQLMFAADSDESIVCPVCGKRDARRLLSSFSSGSTGSGKGMGSGLSSGCSSAPGGFT